MADPTKRLRAVVRLMERDEMSWSTWEDVYVIGSGIDPRIDAVLKPLHTQVSQVKKLFSQDYLGFAIDQLPEDTDDQKRFKKMLGKIQKGDLVGIVVDELPENTEEEKKRKKAVLLWIQLAKQLKVELKRVSAELGDSFDDVSLDETPTSVARLMRSAKGPWGLVTVVAIVLVLLSVWWLGTGKTGLHIDNTEIGGHGKTTLDTDDSLGEEAKEATGGMMVQVSIPPLVINVGQSELSTRSGDME